MRFVFTPSAVSLYDPSRENSVWSAPQSATNAKFKIFFPLKMARAKRKPFKIVSALQTAHLYPLLQKIAFSANLCLTTDRLSDIIEHVPAVRCRTNLSDHGPVAQLVRAPACHAGGRRFEPDPGRCCFSGSSLYASVAQSVEQGTENPRVIGSIPIGGTLYAAVAHLVERHLAKVEVASSSLVGRSRQNKPLQNMIRRVMQRLFCTLKAFLELEKEGKTQ